MDMRLRRAWQQRLQALAQRVQLAQRGLDAISPLATLDRGYAIVTTAAGTAVTDASVLSVGESLSLRFARGAATASVASIQAGQKKGA
jgi:exodeoxyribonuclease VII large subunit